MFEQKIYRSPNAGFYGDVLLCCMPLLAMSYVLYGPRPVILAAISCAMAYLLDRLLAPLHGPDYHNGELSSESFAVLLTLLMPANVSAYVLAFAVVTAVVIKEVFGGAGHYPFNPACVGYVVAAVSWPVEVFQYPAVGRIPITGTGSLVLYESASATLRSGGVPNLTTTQLLVGNYAGPMGTGFTLILLSLGLYLLVRKRISLFTVLPYLMAYALVVWFFPRIGNVPVFTAPWSYLPARLTSLKFEMLSGAVIFGGVFLLSEPVTQPKTRASRAAYGFLVGFVAVMFRYYGVYETGICFSVLILNSLSTRLDIMVEWVMNRITGEADETRKEPDTMVYQPRPKKAAPVDSGTQMMETMALDAKMMTPMTQTVSRAEVRTRAEEAEAEPAEPAPSARSQERRRRQRFAETARTLMLPDIRAELNKSRKEDNDGQ